MSIRWRVKHLLRRRLLDQYVVFGPRDRLILGQDVWLANALVNTVCGSVTVGDRSFLGHDVMLLTGTHDHRARGQARQIALRRTDRDIRIGEGVWIASRATVIGPCSIGDDSVVAAGCVVSEDVPSGSIVRLEQTQTVEPISFRDEKSTDGAA